MREFSLRATFLGLAFGFFFAVANGYLALKVGTTISASIPAAILSMAIFRTFFKKPTILENNIVQTIATVGEGLAAGVTFTIPALILMGDSPSIGRIFLLASLGGILGILFMIPMRRFIIVGEHERLPFPEGTACAVILKAGEKVGSSTLTALWGFLSGTVYKLLCNVLFLWEEVPIWTLKFFKKTQFSIDATPALLGVGYIIGPRVSGYLLAGGILAWWVIIPLIYTFALGNGIVYPASVPVADMSADEIWDKYVRYIGAGAIATGGIGSVLKVFPLLYRSMRVTAKDFFSGFKEKKSVPRTEKDIPMSWLLLGSLAILLILWLAPNLPMNFFTILLLIILGFFFVAVTSMTVGLVGSTSNPTSGMTITTLLITCLAFVALGWTERIYLISALTMGCVSCCAICLAGTTAQDLKTGFLLGATPRSQQVAEILGVFIPALAIGYTVYILNAAYQIGSAVMPAPQATLMSLIVNGVMTHEIPYALVGVGICIGLIAGILRIPIMPFAIGLYLPLSLTSATMAGGLVKAWVERKPLGEEKEQKGLLFASGMIGGDACTGVIVALLAVSQIISPSQAPLFSDWVSLAAYSFLAIGLGWVVLRKR